MIEQLEELLKQVENSEVIPCAVRIIKKIYDGLISAGFSQDQAMDIITHLKLGGKE